MTTFRTMLSLTLHSEDWNEIHFRDWIVYSNRRQTTEIVYGISAETLHKLVATYEHS